MLSIDERELIMSNHEMQEFADRVNQMLDKKGFPRKHEGRQTKLGKALKADQKGVGRWLEGKGYPSSNNLEKLAEFLDSTPAYLRYGIDTYANSNCDVVDILGDSTKRFDDTVTNVTMDTVISGFVPLISLSKLSSEVMGTHQHSKVPSPLATTGDLFASTVEGSSMDRTGHNGYPNGSRIFWRKRTTAETGDHVVADTSDGVVFRELDIDAGTPVLKPLNPQYPIIRGEFQIIGVVVSKSQDVPNSLLDS